jgi:hypothetical protein
VTTFRRVPPEAPRTRFGAYYDRYADLLGIDRVVGRWELARATDRPPQGVAPGMPYASGDVPAELAFVASTNNGVILWAAGAPRMLSPGRHFGLTLRGGRVYAFQLTGRHGRVVSFDAGENRPDRIVTHLYGFNRWIHQLDFVDDELVVVDTLRNRLLIYPDVERARRRSCATSHRTIPLTPADRRGRESPNYRHFNSIYRHGAAIYVMAHNHTFVTGRKSEIWILDRRYRLQEVLPAGGSCCHNMIMHETGLITCRSLEQTVAVGGHDVFKAAGFTRGAAYDGKWLLIGCSTFAEDFAGRDHDDSKVAVLASDMTVLGHVNFPRSSIRDIRLLTGDRGLSNHGSPPVRYNRTPT